MTDRPRPPGADYEIVTERLMDALGEQATVETLELTRLKRFRGEKTGTQLTIDIWWQFRTDTGIHSLAFQCKDWSSRIKQEHVYAFKGVIDDLPGSPRGVMVTRTGYQKGAKRVAEAHGITILELRAPSAADWKGKVKDIHITLVAVHPQWRNFTLMLPEGHPETPDELPPAFGGHMEDMILVDDLGQPVTSVRAILEQYLPKGFDTADWESIEHRFPEVLFLQPPANHAPARLPVMGISFEVAQTKSEQPISLRGDELVRYILRDALNEDAITFGRDEKPRGANPPAAWLFPDEGSE